MPHNIHAAGSAPEPITVLQQFSGTLPTGDSLGEQIMGPVDLTPLGIRRQLVELMFSALPSIVLIVLGHGLAGFTAWTLSDEPTILAATLVGLGIGAYRVLLCVLFNRRSTDSDSIGELNRWTRLYGVGGVAYSLSLAWLTGISLYIAQVEMALLCITVSMSYTVGMIIRVAVVPHVARLQLLALFLPIAGIAFWHGGTAYVVLGLLTSMFCVGGLQLIQHMHATIISRLEAERSYAKLALYDHLTGLPNRAHFHDVADARCAAGNGRGLVVLAAIDLDGFKQVNDLFGHEAGDLLLQECAGRMRAALGEHHLLARLGGDEFSLLFDQGTTLDQAEACARAILSAIEVPFHISGKALRVTASIGVATHHDGRAGLTILAGDADRQLYRAKARGRNRVEIQLNDTFPIPPLGRAQHPAESGNSATRLTAKVAEA
ncbi:diguanylate cyclase domain-containing protein [Devosia albogilva]|uniref:diguanylate cyclase n=1 Tax=Devosia albogilva TaxID=429726 RepID=A0ABW5QMY2_9HYPH